MQPDLDRSAAAMVAGTQKAIAAAVGPLLKRIEALEARPQPEQGEKGLDGLPGADGVGVADIDLSDGVLIFRLSDGTEKQLGSIIGPAGQKGEDGASPDPEAIAESFRPVAEAIVSGVVAAGLANLPPPEKGEPGDKGEPGNDGCGIRDLVIDRDGALIVSMEDGRMKNLGSILGKDGDPGKDGADGFGLDDFDCEPIDERTIKLKFTRGDTMHSYELEFPVIIDRGVFKQGETYKHGDAVTWGGSLWIAQVETNAKPDSPESGWRLAVKKGRDGKDAK